MDVAGNPTLSVANIIAPSPLLELQRSRPPGVVQTINELPLTRQKPPNRYDVVLRRPCEKDYSGVEPLKVATKHQPIWLKTPIMAISTNSFAFKESDGT